MKKVISTTLAALTIALSVVSFSSCETKHECEFCGEEKKCEAITLYDEIIYACDDCVGENKVHECDFCGEEKKCKVNLALGEPIYTCYDCADELSDIWDE